MRISSLLISMVGWMGLACACGAADFCSNQITGTLTFNNADPAVLSLLDAPGNDGMTELFVYANGVPAGRYATSPVQPAAGRTTGSYAVTVDVDCVENAGLAYQISPVAILANGQQYHFNPQTSGPVSADLPGPVVDFEECPGVVQFRFVSPEGAPISVNEGTIFAYRTTDSSYAAVLSSIAGGSTEQRLYVQGGQEHRIDLRLTLGTDPYTDRQLHLVSSNITVACDTILEVDIVVPAFDTLGQIVGTVDMLREFEWSLDGSDELVYPDYTTVMANYGPFQNQRWDSLPGDNLLMPSSGQFTLINVAPSTLDPSSPGYAVEAQMLFRSGRAVQHFGTPGLGWGNNPAVAVAPGESLDLGTIFQIDPGYVRGGILLQGPAPAPGRTPLLRGVQHASDNDLDSDGIPDGAGNLGVYWSSIAYEGVDRLAADATYTAAHGYGYGDFDGDFDAPSDAFVGQYELALGGLQGERSIWRPSYLTLSLNSAEGSSDEEYFFNAYSISDRRNVELEVVPNEPLMNDVAYCFSEIIVSFSSPSASFYGPQVICQGSFAGTDFQGQPADYSVDYAQTFGTPLYESQAANRGQVVMLLPQGTYTLNPSVNSSGGLIGLAPIELTVGCGERILLEACLQMDLVIPDCAQGAALELTGDVRTACGNSVVEMSYTLNSGEPVSICVDCGPDPVFAFTVLLAEGDNALTVTARDDQGAVASVSRTLRPDATAPVIVCPDDAVAEANVACGAVLEFSAAATDNCDPAPGVACAPASGSVFPPGDTLVTCVATDLSGNSAQCSFSITVNSGAAAPDPTVSEISPGTIAVAGGTPLTVTGTGFTIDDEVLLDGVPLLYPVLVSATEMQGQAPPLPAGPHQLQIRRCGQILATVAQACQSSGLPRIFTIDPRQAFARGGSHVLVTGTNFLPETQIRIAFPAAGGTENLLLDTSVSEDGTTIIGIVPALPMGETLGPRDVWAEDARGRETLPAGICYLPDPLELDPQVISLRQLQAVSTQPVDLTWRNGFPGGLTARVQVGGGSPQERARAFVRTFKDLLRVINPDAELSITRINQEGLDDVRFVQTYRTLPVFGAEIVVTLSGDEVVALTGNLLPLGALDERAFSTAPDLTPAEAVELARLDENIQRPVDELNALAELMIYDQRIFTEGPLDPHLVYVVQMTFAAHDVLVDAHTGAVVARLARERTHEFNLDIQDAEGEANAQDDWCFNLSDDVDVADEDDFNSDYDGDLDAVLAHRFAIDCWAHFHHHFEWGSYDNESSELEIFIHTTIDPRVVASWTPGCDTMQFADGAVDYEVMVHEFTHGIVKSTSGLTYMFQSGALDEHYADTMSVIADRERGEVENPGQPVNWMLGENLRMTQMNADGTPVVQIPPRNFQNPLERGGQRDQMANLCCATDPATDFGGVHINSGIPNKGAYLMIEGGSFRGYLVQGIGPAKVRLIKFSALRNLPNNAIFADARAREIVSAEYFVSQGQGGITPQDICTLRNGWAAVGVGMGDSDCNGIEDARQDLDGDLIPNRLDNCPYFANPGQEDPDGDKLGGVQQRDAAGNLVNVGCDNCPNIPNPGQEDIDNDNIGDICDDDIDGDGCRNNVDQDPTSNQSKVGSFQAPFCSVTGGPIYAFAGADSILDEDTILNCEDLDDDGDDIPDHEDPCPVGPLNYSNLGDCTVIRSCPVLAYDWWRTCLGGGCVQFYSRIVNVINPDPTAALLVDRVSIVNQTLYLQPNAGNSLSSLAQQIAQVGPRLAGGPQAQPAELSLLRVELWARATETEPARLVAVVGEYNPATLELGQLDSGRMLALTLGSAGGPSTLEATWHPGAAPATASQDSDGDGLPDGWEIQHALSANDPTDAALDFDGDGVSNLDEFQGGTDPRDPGSAFRILHFARTAGGVQVDFVGTPGRRFHLERSVDLSDPDWTSAAELYGRGGIVSLSDAEPAPAGQAFYRLRSVAE